MVSSEAGFVSFRTRYHERPRRAAEHRDELAALHSSTSSARAGCRAAEQR
jgi:hypothetical protein